MDDGRCAVDLFVPLGRPRQQLAITVAAGNVGEDDRRQSAGVMQSFALPIDAAFIGQFAQHALERGAVGILRAKSARNLTDADFAAVLADKVDKFLA
jgi:hypothetical protein